MVADPSKGDGIFVRRKDMAGYIDAIRARSSTSTASRLSDGEFLAQNMTGEVHDAFSVFKVGDPIIGPTHDPNVYQFDTPMHEVSEIDEDDQETFGVVQFPINDDANVILARFAGVTHVRLTGPADKTHASPRSGAYTMEAADSGPCVILFDPGPADEERIARVRIGGGTSSGSSGGGGAELCGCNGAIPVGAVTIDDRQYASVYHFSSPSSEIPAIDVTYDSDLGNWQGDTLEVECADDPEDPGDE